MKSFWQNKGLILFLLALSFRLPFLSEGFGREFDAWSNALNAKILAETGVYEVSRLPGHPLQELFYSLLWSISDQYFFFNFFSALVSAWAVYSFYRILRHHQVVAAFEWALAFNFIPVFFIAGTSAIDYNYALAFILAAYHQFLRKNFAAAGLMIGLATAFRISSIAFLLPFTLFLPWKYWLRLWPMYLVAILSAGLAFLMPLLTYGWEFLDFHKPPFPSWSSILYKLSLGIWGLPFLAFLLISLPAVLKASTTKKAAGTWSLEAVLILIIALQLAVFLRLPFKAEFFIPAIPFLLLFWALRSPVWVGKTVHYVALTSLLFFGFDYANPYRGGEPLPSAFHFEAGGKEIYCSPWQGPLSLDQSKRRVKSTTVALALARLEQMEEPVWLVAGWYWPELKLKLPEDSPHYLDHYSSPAELEAARKAGLRILYLPEIDVQNGLMHDGSHLAPYGEALL